MRRVGKPIGKAPDMQNVWDITETVMDERVVEEIPPNTWEQTPWYLSMERREVTGESVGHICIHIYAKRSIQIYILIFSFIFLSEIICSIIHLYIQIFVYFSEFFFFYYSHKKNCVNIWHSTSNLLLLRCHVPTHHAESNSKRLLKTSQAATRYMRLKPLYQLSLLSDWP